MAPRYAGPFCISQTVHACQGCHFNALQQKNYQRIWPVASIYSKPPSTRVLCDFPGFCETADSSYLQPSLIIHWQLVATRAGACLQLLLCPLTRCGRRGTCAAAASTLSAPQPRQECTAAAACLAATAAGAAEALPASGTLHMSGAGLSTTHSTTDGPHE